MAYDSGIFKQMNSNDKDRTIKKLGLNVVWYACCWAASLQGMK